MLPNHLRKLTIFGVFVIASFAVGIAAEESESANLSSVSVTLSNSRLSFRGALGAGNQVGTSEVLLNTTATAYPSTTSAQLVEGDTVLIGEGASLATYTVTDTPSIGSLNITPVLASGDADTGDDVIATQSASLTVRFTTTNAIANGRFRILVPALTDDTAAADGIPDGGYFDMGTAAPTVTCPSDIANYDFVAGTATASAITIGSADYHSFECAYSGTGGISTAFDGSSNDAITISSLINPAPRSNHIEGTADTYNVLIQHLDSGLDVDDATTVQIGVIEAVKVTATVAPQITFRILGVNEGVTACGANTNVTTTPATVPFGELAISAFTNAAQALSVSTNAVNGYVVTAVANDQLGRNGGACAGDPTISTNGSCIQDSRGDDAVMTHSTPDDWEDTLTKGFAYSLHNVNSVSGMTLPFDFLNNTTVPAASCDTYAGGSDSDYFCARQFADAEDGQTAQSVFSSATVADNHNLYVCYRAVINPSQAAGDYENYLTYTATATF